MSRLCCAGPPFEPFDGGLKRITTDRATGACRGSRGHWPGFSPAGMLKDGVFPSPNRPQSLHSLNLMSDPHLPSGPELCPKPAPGFCPRCRKSLSREFRACHLPHLRRSADSGRILSGLRGLLGRFLSAYPAPSTICRSTLWGRPGSSSRSWGSPPAGSRFAILPIRWPPKLRGIRLEAEGIPTFVDGERMGSRSMYHVATGGVRLMVPDSLAPEPRGSSFRKPGRPWPRRPTSRQSMRMNRSSPSRKATPKPSATPCRYAKALCSSSPSDCQPCF